MSSLVEHERPERRLTLLFIASGGSFGIFGTIVGALYLASLSGLPTGTSYVTFGSHPYLQIFGFLAEFVIGVAYSILPLFKSRKNKRIWLSYSTFALITLGNLILAFSTIFNAPSTMTELAGMMILIAAIVFAYETIGMLGRPSRLLGEAEPFMMLSSISFILAASLFLLQYVRQEEIFSSQFIYLSLLGFVGSMIYGVELRTVAFRMKKYRRVPALVAITFQAVAITVTFIGAIAQFPDLNAGASLLFLGAALSLTFSLKIFERQKAMMPLGSKIGNPNIVSPRMIAGYSSACLGSSSAWLVLALVLGALWQISGDGSFAIRDSFIHSAAIGFIGSTIVAFGPVLLPGVLSGKAPNKNLTLGPLLLLNVSLILRVVGNFFTPLVGGSTLPVWESLSGVFILASMFWFMRTLHFGRK